MKTDKIKIGLIGSGWRSEFYARAAKYVPALFTLTGVVTKRKERGEYFRKEFGADIYETYDEMICKSKPEYVILSISKEAALPVVLDLANKGVAVLMETPAATDYDSLIELNTKLPAGAKVQVAEQYHLQPMHMARLSYIKERKLGRIWQCTVSYTNNFHAISLMRKYLGLGFENGKIAAYRIPIRTMAGFGREGMADKEIVKNLEQTVAVFDFGDKVGIYDFEKDQHRSFIRTQRIQLKGERGEIFNTDIRYMKDFQTPVYADFKRLNKGEDLNMEGCGLKGIQAEGVWHYVNPYSGSNISDDEIAVASCMQKMGEYVRGGKAFYPLAEASQDMYLNLMMEEAAAKGEAVHTKSQIWSTQQGT